MNTERTIFMLVRATSRWLELTPSARHAFVAERLRPLLARFSRVRLRYFDAEAYSARTSDVLMWQSSADDEYRALIEHLRETPFWGTYFEIREIVPSVEEDFARHYGVPGVSSAAPPPPPGRSLT